MAAVFGYVLDENVGFVLRQVTQRHLAIFSEMMVDDLTPTQFSAIVRLYEHGSCSQNRLGRLTAMDGPTIKGVIDRLTRRGITTTNPDQEDSRLLIISLTDAGRRVVERAIPCAKRITEATLAPLSLSQRTQLMALLGAFVPAGEKTDPSSSFPRKRESMVRHLDSRFRGNDRKESPPGAAGIK